VRAGIQGLAEAMPASGARDAGDDELLDALGDLAKMRRLVDAASAVLVAEVRERSRSGLQVESLARRQGRRDAADLVQFVTRQPRGLVNRMMRLGRVVGARHGLDGRILPAAYPALSAAMFEGGVDPTAAVTIAGVLDDVPVACEREFIVAAEQALVYEAKQRVPELVELEAKMWRAVLDPDGAEPREDRQRRLRSLTFSPVDEDGMSVVKVVCPPEHRALLQAVFDTYDNPRTRVAFLEPVGQGDPNSADGDPPDQVEALGPVLADLRSREQRRFDILLGVIAAGLRASETAAGNPREIARIVVTTTIDELDAGRGTAWLDGVSEPVSVVTADRLACDAGVQRLVLGTRGEVLALGRRVEFFTAAQRLAIGVRDGGCIWPGCTAPQEWCEVHHVVFRRHDGPTDVDNGVMLCSAHHHLLHAGEWALRMIHGIPHIRPPLWSNPHRTWVRADRGRARRRHDLVRRLRRG